MAAYGNQSGPVAVFALPVRFLSGLSPLFLLFGALLLPPRSKTGISSLSPACSPFCCLLARSLVFLRERL